MEARRAVAGACTAIAFGAIHPSGDSHSIGTRSGQSRSPAAKAAAATAAWRPLSAAMSAISAPCSRLPAANTPRREVRRAASTNGPRVPGSIARPAITASSWSGIQSAVKTTVSHVTVRARPLSTSVSSTASTRGRPWMALTFVLVHSGVRQRTAAPARNAGIV